METRLAPYSPSLLNIVRRMLLLADVRPGETVIDLGSGDGRIPIIAATEFGAIGIGLEYKQSLVDESMERLKKAEDCFDGVLRVTFHMTDVMDFDISPADVVTLYLTKDGMELIKPKLESDLRSGTRVVAHGFKAVDWKATHEIMVRNAEKVTHIYMYIMGEHHE